MQASIMTEKVAGTKVLAYGYEAVARGALEAGVKVVAGYPGTPSSGALNALASVGGNEGIHVELSTNERVAYELAWGAAMNGQRALCTVNHLGTNVIMDALKYSANYGVTGGLVLFAGDDVGANTSAIESDSRVLAESADIPILCPSTADEARSMTKYAFELSEELGCPVLVRSVCQLMMARTLVQIGEITTTGNKSGFAPNPRRVVMYQPGTMAAVTIHRYMHENLNKAGRLLTAKAYDYIEPEEEAQLGIIACGVSYSLAMEAMARSGIKAAVLKVNVVNPLDEGLICKFANMVNELVVLEEGEAFVEQRVLSILGKLGLAKKVIGRLSGDIPFGGELFINDYIALLSRLSEKEVKLETGDVPYLSERNLTLCGGCSHLGVFYSIRKVLEQENQGKYLAFADAGCAFMGILTPAKSLTSATNMGGAISFASGVAHSGSDAPVLALCGDGGFLHGGISALANAVFNKAQIVVILLDNGTLGNTGLQPTASTGCNLVGQSVPKTDLAAICRDMGVLHVQSVDPYLVDETMDALRAALNAPKPAVIVAKQPCVLNRQKKEKKEGQKPRSAKVDNTKCTDCGSCMELYCSGICWEEREADGKPKIIEACSACGLCAQLCPTGAISIMEDE